MVHYFRLHTCIASAYCTTLNIWFISQYHIRHMMTSHVLVYGNASYENETPSHLVRSTLVAWSLRYGSATTLLPSGSYYLLVACDKLCDNSLMRAVLTVRAWNILTCTDSMFYTQLCSQLMKSPSIRNSKRMKEACSLCPLSSELWALSWILPEVYANPISCTPLLLQYFSLFTSHFTTSLYSFFSPRTHTLHTTCKLICIFCIIVLYTVL